MAMAMASSKLYHHFSSSFLLFKRRSTLTLKPLSSSSSSSLFFIKPYSFSYSNPLALRSLRSCSSSSISAVISDEDVAAAPASSSSSSSSPHPWPEWEQFIDKMRRKGYFAINEVDGGSTDGSSFSPSDLNRIKNACLKFARERFDIFRSLPKEDIQAVVEIGCPNIYRKAVNSAKRLRAFLRLDEGDVCSACNLRGSCDRAYVIEKDDDKARTVDIVRILMSYAVDPALRSGGNNPSITEHVQESARNLLVELSRLSDTTIDPALPKPAAQSASKKEPSSEKSKKDIKESKWSENVEMKRGDWLCSKCNFLNFARNLRCLKCKEDGPKRVDFSSKEMKLGDWTCPNCEFMNFARNKKCFRCQESRPNRELKPGEWECPKCDYVNFRGNTVCKECSCECPESAGGAPSAYEDCLWKLRTAKEKNLVNFGDDEDDKDEEEDMDDEELDNMLPLYEGDNKFVASKRTTPAEWRSNSARNRNNPV